MYAAQNLWQSTVATAPSPATSGTTLVCHAGDGAYLTATPPFPVAIWAAGAAPSLPAGNVELALCTAVSTDTLTITRAQEGVAARTVVAGDQIAAVISAAWLTALLGSATGGNSVSLGASSSASSSFSTAVGNSAVANSGNGTAVGYSASAQAYGGTAVGASATGGSYGVAIGYNANTNTNQGAGTGGIAIGYNANAGPSGVAIGKNALYPATNSSTGTMAIGYQAGYGPNGTTANATTSAAYQTLVGYQTGQSGTTQVAGIVCVGANAIAGGAGAISIGYGASATAAGSIAIGRDSAGTAATSTTTDLAVIGTSLTTLQAGKLSLSNSSTTTTAPGAGGAGALPATPKGYITITIAGTAQQIPYY